MIPIHPWLFPLPPSRFRGFLPSKGFYLFFLRFFLCFTVGVGLFFFSPPTGVDLDLAGLSWGKTWAHPLGCDRLGRDVYAMYSYGILATIGIAIPARLITIGFGLFVSVIAFRLPGLVRFCIHMIAQVFLSLPSLLVALLVLAGLGSNLLALWVAILLSDWAQVYESLKSKIREIENSEYVKGAYAIHASKIHVFKWHILPGLKSMNWFLFLTGIPTVIMALAIYSFLGVDLASDWFGPGLGEQISFSSNYFRSTPHALVTPIFAIVLLILGLGKN
jgi:peptide/nickel transport system permease protein